MEAKTNNKQTTNNTCAGNKGKQPNKQTNRGGTCRGGVELHGALWSPVCNASEYGEASEMHRESIREARSPIRRVVLCHHPPSKRVLPIVGDSRGVGWGRRGSGGGNHG